MNEFVQLAKQCAPQVAPETLAAVARTESGFDPLAIHDNTTGLDHHPITREAAITLATELAVISHHSLDLGLMQIDSANLPALGLTIGNAFDTCKSLAAANRVLVAGYDASTPGNQQQALHRTLSRYNTGDSARGIANGYVARVQASAAIVVPAIQVPQARAGTTATESSERAQNRPLRPSPPLWDVYGQARAARGLGLVFGAARSSPAKPAAPSPLPATSEAMNRAK